MKRVTYIIDVLKIRGENSRERFSMKLMKFMFHLTDMGYANFIFIIFLKLPPNYISIVALKIFIFPWKTY